MSAEVTRSPGGSLPPRASPRRPRGRSPPPPWARWSATRDDTPTPTTPLRHRVRDSVDAWERAGAGNRVLRWIREGVPVSWRAGPPPPFHHGESCADVKGAQRQFMLSELSRLESAGAIQRVPDKGPHVRHVTRMFMVPKPPAVDKWRMVLDLRHLNSFCVEKKCRFESLKDLRRMVREDDWMFSFDLKDGYHAVGIHPRDRKYFTFVVAGVGTFQYCALNFGWNASPYVFVKVMRTLVRLLRSPVTGVGDSESPDDHMVKGMRLLPYMDDFLGLACSREAALAARDYAESVLHALGLSRNAEKGVWDPIQRLEHLGVGIDTASGLFYVPPDKLARITRMAKGLLSRGARCARRVPVRELAAFCGLTQSLYLAMPPARFLNRSLHDAVGTRRHWRSLVVMTSACLRDLRVYAALPHKWTGRAIWRSPMTASLHCDASPKGWGGVLNNRVPAHGFWHPHQRDLHINQLELRAVRYTVERFLEALRGRSVLLWDDSQVVCHILSSWTSRSQALMSQLRKLWWALDMADITLHPRYIRSAANVWADKLSRIAPHDEWCVNTEVFKVLDAVWGPHTVDRFAAACNAQVDRYNSAWAESGATAVDAFAQPLASWCGEHNWCVPPIALLPQLAQLLRETGAGGTVVAPHWPAQAWAQALEELAVETRDFPASLPAFLGSPHSASGPNGPGTWRARCYRIPARQVRPGLGWQG
jgi:ribonuclease HI